MYNHKHKSINNQLKSTNNQHRFINNQHKLYNNQLKLYNNQPQSINNHNLKINLTLKTFQSKKLILIMNNKSIMSKFLMKDNTSNKSHNKELNMFQLLDLWLNIRMLLKQATSQLKKFTLIINKLNISLNTSLTLDKKLRSIISLNKELNNMLIINQSKDLNFSLNQLLLNQLFNNL